MVFANHFKHNLVYSKEILTRFGHNCITEIWKMAPLHKVVCQRLRAVMSQTGGPVQTHFRTYCCCVIHYLYLQDCQYPWAADSRSLAEKEAVFWLMRLKYSASFTQDGLIRGKGLKEKGHLRSYMQHLSRKLHEQHHNTLWERIANPEKSSLTHHCYYE